MSTFRTTPKMGFPTVYNVSMVRASQWNAEGLDGILTYLAASRHLQMPQAISRPLGRDFCSNDGVGDARMSMRVPAFTSFLTTRVLGRLSWPPVVSPPAGWPGSGMTQEIDAGGGFGDISFVPISASDQDNDVSGAQWTATDPQALNDSPDNYEAFPLPITYDDTENDSLVVRIDCSDYTKIHAVWMQSDFLPASTLQTS